MRKVIIFICLFFCSNAIFAQAKKPTIMIMPSDNWCVLNGYYNEYDNQGTKTRVMDYKRAFQENSDMGNVISKINDLMAERGFPLKSLESEMKSLESQSAEDAMTTSKSGADVSESPVDKLKAIAKADIILQIGWTVEKSGFNKTIQFHMEGLDAYTNKQIAGAGKPGEPSANASITTLLHEQILADIDNFNAKLQQHFDDLFKNGREITIRIKKFDSWNDDLEKEYDGKELGTIIEEWVSKNTVNGRYNTTVATGNMMFFEQVRILMYNASGTAIDARAFCKGLQKYLAAPPFSIVNKLTTKGLGQATLILGEK
jgi:hypothetical protein